MAAVRGTGDGAGPDTILQAGPLRSASLRTRSPVRRSAARGGE